jgi:predicted RNA-binding Zn-ribbon protein involved in translation (DUF1610 family)
MSDSNGGRIGTDRDLSNKEEVTCDRVPGSEGEAMICERCGKAEMYRMHAVWRCPECGFKTDCCGW